MARARVYDFLSLAFLYPFSGTVAQLRQTGEAVAAGDFPEGLRKAAESALRILKTMEDDALVEEFIRVFGHGVPKDCPPYETEYGQAHIFQKTHAIASLTAFYQAFGVKLNPEIKDRPDHLGVELEFMQVLARKEAYCLQRAGTEEQLQICRDAQRAFLSDHLAPWVQSFARRVTRKAGQASAYWSLAVVLEHHINNETALFRLPMSRDRGPMPQEEPETDGCAFDQAAAVGGGTT